MPFKLPANFRRIDLRLAREPEHPEGDPNRRYVIIAPLQPDGRLDPQAVRENHAACRVVRYHDGVSAIGHLVHGPGGQWRFHYDLEGEEPDEVGFRLADERFEAGEYVSIKTEGLAHPFRVSAVTELH